jgi:hypothetical protein
MIQNGEGKLNEFRSDKMFIKHIIPKYPVQQYGRRIQNLMKSDLRFGTYMKERRNV